MIFFFVYNNILNFFIIRNCTIFNIKNKIYQILNIYKNKFDNKEIIKNFI